MAKVRNALSLLLRWPCGERFSSEVFNWGHNAIHKANCFTRVTVLMNIIHKRFSSKLWKFSSHKAILLPIVTSDTMIGYFVIKDDYMRDINPIFNKTPCAMSKDHYRNDTSFWWWSCPGRNYLITILHTSTYDNQPNLW